MNMDLHQPSTSFDLMEDNGDTVNSSIIAMVTTALEELEISSTADTQTSDINPGQSHLVIDYATPKDNVSTVSDVTWLNVDGHMIHRPTVRQLIQMLRTSPQTPEQQQQILNILKSNPEIMAAFVKHREAQLLKQHMADMNTTRDAVHTVPNENVSASTSRIESAVPGAVSPASSMNMGTVSSRGGNLSLTEQRQQRHLNGARQRLQQHASYLMQQQLHRRLSARPMQRGLPGARPVHARPDNGQNIIHSQSLQRLVQILESSYLHQAQILQLLRWKPHLMETFIRRRQAQSRGGGTRVAGTSSQYIQHMLTQQQTPVQHHNRMQMQTMLGQAPGQGPNPGPPNILPRTQQQQQWFEHQQILVRQLQHQQQQAQAQAQESEEIGEAEVSSHHIHYRI